VPCLLHAGLPQEQPDPPSSGASSETYAFTDTCPIFKCVPDSKHACSVWLPPSCQWEGGPCLGGEPRAQWSHALDVEVRLDGAWRAVFHLSSSSASQSVSQSGVPLAGLTLDSDSFPSSSSRQIRTWPDIQQATTARAKSAGWRCDRDTDKLCEWLASGRGCVVGRVFAGSGLRCGTLFPASPCWCAWSSLAPRFQRPSFLLSSPPFWSFWAVWSWLEGQAARFFAIDRGETEAGPALEAQIRQSSDALV